ncbi:Uracil DNA glycosylase [Pseudoloma neurophilia]|uniref:Uracil-DNA glycosylase n=1 Tax=Pseudoloma neurophilia TaxID=146866 RepID=A0A0R0LYQ1_9MICR|nr:Uracil DNA glycosylase [Pseudoloma neurophilia]
MSLKAFNFKKKDEKENLENKQDLRLSQRVKCTFSEATIEKECKICNLFLYISKDWYRVFQNEFKELYFADIIKNLHTKDEVFPPVEKIFHFSNFFAITDTKVVIIGQDPYHNVGQATGLAFHVPRNVKNPPSLENIFKEVRSNYKSADCDLESWAKQGVLLLNDTLTVTRSKPNSHSKFGWNVFTDRILSYINENCKNVVFLLWGQFAAKKRALVDENKHLVLISSHPSPFSVLRGFQGCQHFLQANEYLKSKKIDEINW